MVLKWWSLKSSVQWGQVWEARGRGSVWGKFTRGTTSKDKANLHTKSQQRTRAETGARLPGYESSFWHLKAVWLRASKLTYAKHCLTQRRTQDVVVISMIIEPNEIKVGKSRKFLPDLPTPSLTVHPWAIVKKLFWDGLGRMEVGTERDQVGTKGTPAMGFFPSAPKVTAGSIQTTDQNGL